MTVSAKLSASEKIRYNQIAESHDVSLSEWIASILSIYQNGYGELKINSVREDELLNEIDKLNKTINSLKAINGWYKTKLSIDTIF